METEIKARDGRRVAESSAQSGFTLIELMVVVAIIGILAAIGVPQLTRFIRTSQTSEPAQTMGDMARTIQGWVDSRPGVTGLADNLEDRTLEANGGGSLPSLIPQLVLGDNAGWTYTIEQVDISSTGRVSLCIDARKSGDTGVVRFNSDGPFGAEWDGNFLRQNFIVASATIDNCPSFS